MNHKAQALLNAIREACTSEPDVIPPGWLNKTQVVELLHARKSSVSAAISKLLRSGAIERRVFKVKQKARVFPRAFYRLKT